jgi:hypothetical protein
MLFLCDMRFNKVYEKGCLNSYNAKSEDFAL